MFVLLGFPEIFALEVAIGLPTYSISFLAIFPLGILTPIVFCPAVRISGTIFFFFNIIVKGPGKNFPLICTLGQLYLWLLS